MTDLERFKAMYQSFGIELKEEPARGKDKDMLMIWMEQGTHPKFIGYSGFGSRVFFTLDGQFIEQGFWE